MLLCVHHAVTIALHCKHTSEANPMQVTVHHTYATWYCRKAVKSQSRSAYAVPAKELEKLLAQLEGSLKAAALPTQHQHWVMFTALPAYLCCRQCYAALGDRLGLQQVLHPAYAMSLLQPREHLHLISAVCRMFCSSYCGLSQLCIHQGT